MVKRKLLYQLQRRQRKLLYQLERMKLASKYRVPTRKNREEREQQQNEITLKFVHDDLIDGAQIKCSRLDLLGQLKRKVRLQKYSLKSGTSRYLWRSMAERVASVGIFCHLVFTCQKQVWEDMGFEAKGIPLDCIRFHTYVYCKVSFELTESYV